MVPPDFVKLYVYSANASCFTFIHDNGIEPPSHFLLRTREGLIRLLLIAFHQPATLWKEERNGRYPLSLFLVRTRPNLGRIPEFCYTLADSRSDVNTFLLIFP